MGRSSTSGLKLRGIAQRPLPAIPLVGSPFKVGCNIVTQLCHTPARLDIPVQDGPFGGLKHLSLKVRD
jgi:hypothetical protein